jgi:hypothetical protein
MKFVPSFDMVRKSRSPLLSMHVIRLRSTVHVRPFCGRCLFFQFALSSPTHGCTKRPSRVHLCSVAVSAIVIRSIRVARFLRPAAVVPSSAERFDQLISSASPTRNIQELDVVRNRLRIWTSDPPRSKCTSSIYAFIRSIPRPCSGSGSDMNPLLPVFPKSNPFP